MCVCLLVDVILQIDRYFDGYQYAILFPDDISASDPDCWVYKYASMHEN